MEQFSGRDAAKIRPNTLSKFNLLFNIDVNFLSFAGNNFHESGRSACELFLQNGGKLVLDSWERHHIVRLSLQPVSIELTKRVT